MAMEKTIRKKYYLRIHRLLVKAWLAFDEGEFAAGDASDGPGYFDVDKDDIPQGHADILEELVHSVEDNMDTLGIAFTSLEEVK